MLTLIWGACRFILYFKWPIERSPLQVYHSALVFSPSCSLIRGLFEQEQPQWITTKSTIEDNWGACVQTLEGHSASVTSIIFSHDSKLLASASYDDTIRVWDARSGQCLQTLNFGRVVIVKSFDITNTYLSTDHGTMYLSPVSEETQAETDLEIPRFQGYGVSSDHTWITWKFHVYLVILLEPAP